MTLAISTPTIRPRRLRLTAGIRRMVRETTLSPADFIYPLFVRHGQRSAPADQVDARRLAVDGGQAGR